MPKPPLPDRIKALEEQNRLLIDKIDRMRAQVRHNREVIKKYQRREDKKDVQALMNEIQAERHRRADQSRRDKKRDKEARQSEYRRQMEKRLHDCRVMNGLEPRDD